MKKFGTTKQKRALAALADSAGEVAVLLRAIGNERRLMLLCLLVEHDELAAGSLAEGIELSPSATSQHLSKMRDEGLIASRRDAKAIYYRIADPRVTRLLMLLKELYCK